MAAAARGRSTVFMRRLVGDLFDLSGERVGLREFSPCELVGLRTGARVTSW